jgi:nicotinamide-nucleotide amidase
MTFEIINIGDEVLSGQTLNTNAFYLSQELERAGFLVCRHVTLPDNPHLLKRGLQEALARNNYVITTGGLGPTLDDNTRRIAAEIFDSDFILNEEIAEDLKRRYGENLSSLIDQATVPKKAIILKNEIGTAPGFIFINDKKVLLLLPGPPVEMKKMFFEKALPHLHLLTQGQAKYYTKSVNLFNLPESAVDPLLRELSLKYPTIQIGIYSSYGILNVCLKVIAKNEEEANPLLAEPYQEICNHYRSFLFESNSGKIEESIHKRFIEKKLTLSVAESCTGGNLAARLTKNQGASVYFLGAIVPYSNELKTQLLGVSKDLLDMKGAVSQEVVEKMTAGILKLTGSDFALAVTGIAGPTGGSIEKPVGTVWCGIGQKNGSIHTWKIKGNGSREMIIERSINSLLAELLLRTT